MPESRQNAAIMMAELEGARIERNGAGRGSKAKRRQIDALPPAGILARADIEGYAEPRQLAGHRPVFGLGFMGVSAAADGVCGVIKGKALVLGQ